MSKKYWSEQLYLFNAALLITHEIDSAFWKEWELFGVPGGIQFFLILNLLLTFLVLIGYKNILQKKRSGHFFSLMLGASGIFAFCIHNYFILQGRSEFTLPASIVLLYLVLIVSLAQGIVTIKDLRAKA